MTSFVDGPAAGVALMLRRAPTFLRVVRSANGKWDALDQLADEPEAGEVLVAYQRVGPAGWVHIDYTRRRSAWFKVAQYSVVADQPDDATMRERDRWRAWCWAQVGRSAETPTASG